MKVSMTLGPRIGEQDIKIGKNDNKFKVEKLGLILEFQGTKHVQRPAA